MKDNTDRLLNAIEHPDRFSDEELDALFASPDTRKLYNMISKTADSQAETAIPDIDQEWERFAADHLRSSIKNAVRLPFSRHAAAVTAACLVALAVVAATLSIPYISKLHNNTVTDSVERHNADTMTAGCTASPFTTLTDMDTTTVIVFKKESFDNIISAICEYYEATATFENDSIKNLHLYFKWDKSLALEEVIEQLNSFERIDITPTHNALIIK